MEIRKVFGDFGGAVGGAVRSGYTDDGDKLLILQQESVERETGFEPATSTLARLRSTS